MIDPADLRVVLGKPVVSEEHLGLAQVDDGELQNLRMRDAIGVVHEEFNLDVVCNVPSAVGRAIGISSRERGSEGSDCQLVLGSGRRVYTRDHASTVKQGV